MGYSENWKILEEIIIEFRKKSLPVPENVMSDLKSAKTLIKLMNSDSGQGEIGPRVEQYLSSVEAYLVTEAQKSFPPERIDWWLRQLAGSSCDVCAGQAKKAVEEEQRIVSGLPRDQKWVRVAPIASLPQGKLEQLAKESDLSVKVEKDGHLIVYGTAESIREFVKRMTAQASKEQT